MSKNFSHLHIWTTAIYFQPNEHIQMQIVWYFKQGEIQRPVYRDTQALARGVELIDIDSGNCIIEYLGELWQFELNPQTDRGDYRYSGIRINHGDLHPHYESLYDIAQANKPREDYDYGFSEAYQEPQDRQYVAEDMIRRLRG